MKHKVLSLIFFFALSSLFYAATDNNQNFYKINLIIGEVEISQPDSDYWEEAENEMLLSEDTLIRTGADSYCDLLLPKEEGIFRIADNSIVKLEKVGKKIKKLRLKKGKIFVNIVPKKHRGKIFAVETKVAVAAVRGTQFVVQTDEEKVKTQVTRGRVLIRRNLSLPSVKGLNHNAVEVETEAGEEIEMTLAENRQLESLLSRVKNNLRQYRQTLETARQKDYQRKKLIRSVKEIMADLYDADNRLQNYGEDEKALDEQIQKIHKRRW